jgi:hypothetical protein
VFPLDVPGADFPRLLSLHEIAAQMAAQELSCLPFLGPGRPRAAGLAPGPTMVERVRTLAAGPPGLPPVAQPVGLTPGQQMPHITLHTVQVPARAARSNAAVTNCVPARAGGAQRRARARAACGGSPRRPSRALCSLGRVTARTGRRPDQSPGPAAGGPGGAGRADRPVEHDRDLPRPALPGARPGAPRVPGLHAADGLAGLHARSAPPSVLPGRLAAQTGTPLR